MANESLPPCLLRLLIAATSPRSGSSPAAATPIAAWTAEGGSNGTGITTGNSGGASGDPFDNVSLGTGATATYDNAQARGTLSAKLATVGAADCSLNYVTTVGTQTQAWFRAYLYIPSNPGTNHRLIDAFDSVSGQLCFAIYLTSGGKLQTVNTGGGQIQIMTSSIPLNAWFRVEAMVIGSATVGQIEVKRFDSPDSTTADETITSTAVQNTRGSFNNYRFGASGDPMPAGRTLWLDDLGISITGYLGPTGLPAANITLNEAGASSEDPTVVATTALSDAGTGSDAIAATTAVALADAGTASDAVAVGFAIGLPDAGSGSDTLSVTATTPLADTGSGADALAAAATVALADAASAAQAANVTATVPVTDTASTSEALASGVPISVGDAGAAVDSLALTAITVALAETATAAEVVVPAAAVPLAQAASAADLLGVLVPLALAEAGSATDALGVVRAVALTDTAVAADVVLASQQTSSNIALADAGTAFDRLCAVLHRPTSGTTTRPAGGTTARPGTGSTTRPASGTTTRPNSGVTYRG